MSFINRLFKSRLAQNGMWLGVLQIFNTIIPILTLPYITRILSKAAYGEFSVALNWVSYFQVIVEYGFGLTGARKVSMSQKESDISDIRSNIITGRFLLMLLCFAIFSIIACFSGISTTQIICMLIMMIMIVAIVFQQTWFFQGISEMKNITIINVISRTISVILIFLLVKSPHDLYLYCLLYVSNYVIAGIAGCIVVSRKYNIKFKYNGFKAAICEIKEGWPLFVSSAMTKIFGNIGVTILGIFALKEVVGVYSAISKIPFVLTLLFGAVSQALYPQMCKSFAGSFEGGIASVKKYAAAVLSVFAAFGIFLIVFNKPIVSIAFGKDYADDSLLLIPFVIWALLGIVNNFLGIQILVAAGFQKQYSRAFAISVVSMAVLMMLLGYIWNAYGIAIASMCSELILSIILLYYINKVRNFN